MRTEAVDLLTQLAYDSRKEQYSGSPISFATFKEKTGSNLGMARRPLLVQPVGNSVCNRRLARTGHTVEPEKAFTRRLFSPCFDGFQQFSSSPRVAGSVV